jgi:hypothetical protein
MYKRAFKGGKIKDPSILIDVMFYSYCTSFTVDPKEALHTPVSLIKKMLTIHSVAKELEQEEYDKLKTK